MMHKHRLWLADRIAVLMGTNWNSVHVGLIFVTCKLPKPVSQLASGHHFMSNEITLRHGLSPTKAFDVEVVAQDLTRRLKEQLEIWAAADLARRLG